MEISFSITKGAGSINHNRRSFKAENVDASRSINNITLIDEDIKTVYDEVFGKALERYNAKQRRTDRKIKNYYDKIKHSNQEKPFYELIVQLGNKDNPNEIQQDCISVLEEFVDYMKTRYGNNIVIFGAYIHLDEATPHVHIDYVPVCHNQKRGLETRNSQNLATKEMGFFKYADWREELMSNLEMIAKEHNFKRLNMKNTEKHISIQKYKDAMLELENAKEKLSEYDDLILDTKREINALEASSEPLFFKRLLDTLLEFIDKVIMPFLPKELANRIDKILGSRTYGELENAMANEIDGADIDYDY